MPAEYVELRAHTAFSFGDGACTPEALVARAAELGYPAIGVTDAADLGGVVRFVLEARRRSVRPIVGAELSVGRHVAAFLAANETGYHNLAGLVTKARVGRLEDWTAGGLDSAARRLGGSAARRGGSAAARAGRYAPERGHAAVSWHDVAARSDGLLALTGPPTGEIPTLLRAPRYLDRGGRLLHDALTALRAGRTLDQAAREGLLLPNGSWKLAGPGEMLREWAPRPRGLEQTLRVAERCSFDLRWMRPPLPHFEVPAGHDDDSWLRECAYAGARERWGEPTTEQCRQLEHELAVIGRLGFAGFFLVMWDAVRKARELRILCQGRGSAANSAVAYCLGVTAVDPVANGLLFERFLSETRVDGQTEAPDIDLDVEHDRREELLDYVYGRWDRSRAAIACTVQHYRAPNAVLDAMRALGYAPDLAHQLSRRLHYDDPADGAERLVKDGLAKRFGLRLDDARGRAVLALMRACEGLPRMRSTHVGGFILSSAPLGDWLPIEHTTMGRTILQFDKDDLDSLGVPKFDFLGLGALSLVRRAFDVIETRTGRRPELYTLPQDDGDTYDLISRGETIGTFQIESRAQIASILHTRPERLYDIVVQVSLIRPGPIQARFVHPYTRRRRGQEEVTYRHPRLEPILRRTQGIPIFQEQAMAIAMGLAGCTAAEADALRRTMGAMRKRDRLFAELDLLEQRMVRQGITAEVAHQIRADLEGFANYGFPESHAWSFALIAYATAWLKQHHPAAFYAGLLNSWPMGFYPPSTLVHDARRMGVEVRGPCLGAGDRWCTVETGGSAAGSSAARRLGGSATGGSAAGGSGAGDALRIGWRHVRGMGDRTLDRIDRAREARGFASIADLVQRAGLTRQEVLALARAGALSAWDGDRRRAAWEGLRAAGDTLPLAPASAPAYTPRPLTRDELIALDYHALGMSLTGHPMERVRGKLRRARVLDSNDLLGLQGGERVLVAGLVTIRQRPESANGTIFLLLEDEHGFINVIASARKVAEYTEVVKYAPFVIVAGRFERDGEVRNVVGDRFEELTYGRLTHVARSFR